MAGHLRGGDGASRQPDGDFGEWGRRREDTRTSSAPPTICRPAAIPEPAATTKAATTTKATATRCKATAARCKTTAAVRAARGKATTKATVEATAEATAEATSIAAGRVATGRAGCSWGGGGGWHAGPAGIGPRCVFVLPC